jgi:hypothetical protein
VHAPPTPAVAAAAAVPPPASTVASLSLHHQTDRVMFSKNPVGRPRKSGAPSRAHSLPFQQQQQHHQPDSRKRKDCYISATQ